jgi:hypothetical protein
MRPGEQMFQRPDHPDVLLNEMRWTAGALDRCEQGFALARSRQGEEFRHGSSRR